MFFTGGQFKRFIGRGHLRFSKGLLLAAAPITALALQDLWKWDTDWDFRNDRVKGKTSSKRIFLIRHGQYVANDPLLVKNTANDEEDYVLNDHKRPLTALGRKQAALTGQRLAEILQKEGLSPIIYASDMTRAKETAQIIKKCIEERNADPIPLRIDSILREGPPVRPEPEHSTWKPSQASFSAEGARIEAAFKKFFHRVDSVPSDSEKDQVYILVGHGNVWRYCFLRALQLPPQAWLSLSLYNASITSLKIKPNGSVNCTGLGETGHMPLDHITYA